MTERLLHYIWQFQYFNRRELHTSEGESLQVIHPGVYNTNQGPDFTNAKIRLNSTLWAGSVELHINSTDWKNHKHSGDDNYRNVILHVVWQEDAALGLPFPTLVLQDKVSKLLLNKYDELMNAVSFIPCAGSIQHVSHLTWTSWKERLLAERLQAKTRIILRFLEQNNFHWEETLWWLLARNFGTPVNSQVFESMARSIPIGVLSKHKNQLQQVEALLFGQSGLLDTDHTEHYPVLLKKEYQFLKKKYGLHAIGRPPAFLRMRPSNFPSLRLAQLAMLVHESSHLFSRIRDGQDLQELRSLLNITANDYWHYHYVFDEPSSYKVKRLGAQMIDNILINTVIPILFAYGHHQNDQRYKNKALRWLEEIKAEKNSITHGFESLQIPSKTALDSQSFIQLKSGYCSKKRCLDCAIGTKLIGR